MRGIPLWVVAQLIALVAPQHRWQAARAQSIARLPTGRLYQVILLNNIRPSKHITAFTTASAAGVRRQASTLHIALSDYTGRFVALNENNKGSWGSPCGRCQR